MDLFLTKYFEKNNTEEALRDELTDAYEKTIHCLLNNDHETVTILSAEEMQKRIGAKAYVMLLTKSMEYGHCEARYDKNTILYFETESSIYAKTLLENMSAKIQAHENNIIFSLPDERRISIAFNGGKYMTAKIMNSTQNEIENKINEYNIKCSKTDIKKISRTIKAILHHELPNCK